MHIKMTAKRGGDEVIAEAIFEIASADDLNVFSRATLERFRRLQPGVGLTDEDVTIYWDRAD
jgi:hypothetical protein